MLLKNTINKNSFVIILCIVLSVVLLLTVSFIFSSVKFYIITETKTSSGTFHVQITAQNIKHNHLKKVIKNGNHYTIWFDSINKTKKYTNEICKKNKCMKIKYNTKLIKLYTDKTVNKLLIITTTFLSGAAFLIIYNVFNISYFQRKKQISIYKSIGMTKGSILKMILEETFILLLIGIIIGTVISVWFASILLVIINYLMKEVIIFHFKYYPEFIVISYFFIIMVVLFSSLIPAFKLSKTSIISDIKGNNTYKIRKCKKKNIIKKLAFYNYKRGKKKYRSIILCIVVSISIYIVGSLYLNYGLVSLKNYQTNYKYQVMSSEEKILKFKNGKSYKMCFSHLKNSENKKLIVVSSNKEFVINKLKTTNKKYLKDKFSIDNKIINQTKTIPPGLDSFIGEDSAVFLTNSFNNYCSNYFYTVFINKKINNFEEEIDKYAKEKNISVDYINYEKAKKLTNNFILAIKIVLYSVLALTIIIGFTSTINIVRININSRKGELITLKSIGVSKKQINKIIFIETVYIIRKAFLIVLILIIIINYLLYTSITNVYETNIIIPYREILVSILISFTIIFLTFKNNYKKFNQMSTSSVLLKENGQ